MTRKEAEELTGLTTKSIRHYEEKGLINIERQDDNDYREFSESDIVILKFIRILRYVGFSTIEIGEMLTSDNVVDMVKSKLKVLKENQKKENSKLDLCDFIIKDYSKGSMKEFVEDYGGMVDLLESEEWKEVKSIASKYHFKMAIWNTIICLGPIGWLFVNIYEKNWSKLYLNGLYAIIASSYLTIVWMRYFYKWRKM